VLTLENDFDFSLLGISCHVKDYRLSWEINKTLKLDFVKTDLTSDLPEDPSISVSVYFEEDTHIEYTLIANKYVDGLWFPELPQLDYFMRISGPQHAELAEYCKQMVQNIDSVLTVLTINPNELKSKVNLVF